MLTQTTVSDPIRAEAIATAKQWLAAPCLFFDTETTGRNGNVVEITLVDHRGEVLMDTLVNPLLGIPADAVAVHGITEEMCRWSPTFEDLWPQLKPLILGRLLIAYNVDFDRRMLLNSAGLKVPPTEFQKDVWDTCGASQHPHPLAPQFACAMKLYSRFVHHPSGKGGYRWFKLSEAAAQSGIVLPENLHRARADTELCRLLVEWIAKQEA